MQKYREYKKLYPIDIKIFDEKGKIKDWKQKQVFVIV